MHNIAPSPVIIADYRERSSGIPILLSQYDAQVIVDHLKIGDYVINNEMIIERKSGEDFIQSLLSDRLFTQCARLNKSAFRPFLLLEGNPFRTAHDIDRNAIKGALLSVVSSWQIPIIYSGNPEDSTNLLLMLARQGLQQNHLVRANGGYKPKRLINRRLRFIQGLPNTGPVLANRLYNHFGSIKAIINADVEELQKIEGIGKKLADRILSFVQRP